MILVTGAAGTLGKEVGKQLAEKNLEFKCLVRKTSKTEALEKVGASLVYGDVRDREALEKAMNGVTQVISMHSLGIQKKGVTYWDVDYQGNINLIDLLKKNGGGKFVYVSALGVSLEARFQLYKVKQLVTNALEVSGLDYTVFKPSGFFSDFTQAINFIKKRGIMPAMGSSENRVQGVFMGDLAYCMIDSLSNEKAHNRVFVIGGPEALTYRQIAGIYEKLLNRKIRVLPIPAVFQKLVGFLVDTFTGYRYDIQGFIDAFSSGDSTCDNAPLHEVFEIKLETFENYLSGSFFVFHYMRTSYSWLFLRLICLLT